ncbi:unnamed protein product, partial [marine sediment metagenome]
MEYILWLKLQKYYLPLKKIIQALNKISSDADEIIIATDYDREGELIGYDAMQLVKEKNALAPAKRAKFSAITPKGINQAFSKLGRIDLD